MTSTNPLTRRARHLRNPGAVVDRALFYNKDLLKRAGFVDAKGEAQPPRTWPELAAMALKTTERNARNARGAITRLGFAPNYGNAWLYLYGSRRA